MKTNLLPYRLMATGVVAQLLLLFIRAYESTEKVYFGPVISIPLLILSYAVACLIIHK